MELKLMMILISMRLMVVLVLVSSRVLLEMLLILELELEGREVGLSLGQEGQAAEHLEAHRGQL